MDIKFRNNFLYIGALNGQKATIDASGLLNSDRVFHVLSGGKLGLIDVIVTGGLSNSDGGGIYVETIYVEDVKIYGVLHLKNASVVNNKSGDSGGGIYNSGITYLDGSTVSNNSSTVYYYGGGGGIYNSGSGTLTAINSTISNNYQGGGIYNFGTLTAINTTVSGNVGGGIESSSSSLSLLNTTVSGNTSSRGTGGIDNSEGIINIINSTITNNTSSNTFGSVGGINNSRGTVNLRNTIVAGNFAQGYPDLSGSFNGNNNNLIGDLEGASGTVGTGTDIVNTNPGLGPLQNNGGLTETHALLAGSPALNAGNNNLIVADSEDIDQDSDTTEQFPFDQRGNQSQGFSRIFGGIVDIGAFELQEALPNITLAVSPTSVTEDGTSNLVYTFTRTGSTTNALSVNYSITGTADASDYTGATPGTGKTITIAAGSSTAILSINPTADTSVEDDETVALVLASGARYEVGTTGIVTGAIENDDIPVESDGQQITSRDNLRAIPSNTVSVPLFYNTSTGDNTLTGISLRLHYNSTDLTFNGTANLFDTSLFGDISDNVDNRDFDHDANTDRYLQFQYTDFAGNWPNQALPLKLGDFKFSTREEFAGTEINFTSNNLAPGYKLEADSIFVGNQDWNLDIDGNGTIQALSDGIMAVRYMFGAGAAFAGEKLTEGAIAPDATRTTEEIAAYLQQGIDNLWLDIDGNGTIQALSDGIMAVRYMFGVAFDGNKLIEGAIAPDATRDLNQIQAHLALLTVDG